jgi:hypothetical protein
MRKPGTARPDKPLFFVFSFVNLIHLPSSNSDTGPFDLAAFNRQCRLPERLSLAFMLSRGIAETRPGVAPIVFKTIDQNNESPCLDATPRSFLR